MNHTYDVKIVGDEIHWTCPDCGRKRILTADDRYTFIVKGNPSADHTTIMNVCDELRLTVARKDGISEPIPTVFAEWINNEDQ